MKISREELINSMQNIIGVVPVKFYADLLFDSSSQCQIQMSASGERIIANLKNRGLVFRVFDGAQFYEISTSLSEIDLLAKKVKTLISNLEFSPKIDIIRGKPINFKVSIKPDAFQDFTNVSIREKRDRIQDLYDLMKESDECVINPEISYVDKINERIFVNTEGSILRQKIPRIGIILKPMVKISNKIDYEKLTLHGEQGLELLDSITPETIYRLVESSKTLATASLPPTGVFPVILEPSMSGAIAHAIFGHGVQADQILRGRSMWEQYFQKPVASEIVNISDSATNPGLYGSYMFDDEGVLSKKTNIVENGVLKSYLHSRFTASYLDQPDQLNGNGRRQDFHHPLYPRNSNTYFEPGDYNLEEIIQSIDYGILVNNLDFGMEDPISGSIQCNSRSGYLIENGEKTTKVKSIALTGDSLHYLKGITAISKNISKFEGFDSRKGREDIVPVSFGGPFVKISRAIVGSG